MTTFHNFAPGDVFFTLTCDTLAEPGTAGANQTWDFSAITVTSSGSSTALSPSATPYAASYPNATVSTSVGDMYSYSKCNTAGLYIEGAAQPSSTVIYSNDQQYLSYPFTYNSSITDAFSGTVITGMNGTITGTSTTTADGYGTIILPGGATINNVLRVKNTYTRTDDFGTFISTYTNESYAWYSSTRKGPVFSVGTLTTDFFGMVTVVKTVSADGNSVGMKEIETEPSFSIFPNPAAGQVYMDVKKLAITDANVEVMDVLGNIVFSGSIDKMEISDKGLSLINSNILNSGTYFVRINTGSSSSVQKLIVE